MKAKRGLMIAGIVFGSLLTLGPILGILGTVFGMTRAFHTLGSAGVADPKELASSIGSTLMFTATGLFLFPVGILVLVVSIVFYCRIQAGSPPALPGRSGIIGD